LPIFHLYHTKLLLPNRPQNPHKIIVHFGLQNIFFLLATKLPLQIFSSKTWFKEALVTYITLGIIPKKLDNFMNSLLLIPSLVDITHTTDVATPSCTLYSNAFSTMVRASSNKKIHYKKDNSLFDLNQPPTIILITNWSS